MKRIPPNSILRDIPPIVCRCERVYPNNEDTEHWTKMLTAMKYAWDLGYRAAQRDAKKKGRKR